MKRIQLLVFSFIISILSWSCHTTFVSQSVNSKVYRITDSLQYDTKMLEMIQPYSNNVNKTMNIVIGIADKNLDVGKPEGTLGNFMVDAYFAMVQEKYNRKVDAAFMNSGGVRLNQLAAGEVTIGKVFELMPFDNILILQEVDGSLLQKFLDHIADKNGWPVAGIQMQIKNKKAVNVLIGGKPIDLNKKYIIANSDFVANGGDSGDLLKSIPQVNNGYLMRDAIFDYIKKLKDQGKNISAKIENRITNVE